MKRAALVFVAAVAGLLPAVEAQTFVAENFEAVAPGDIPATWLINDGSGGSSTSNMQVAANPSAGGLNPSSLVLEFAGGSNKDITVGSLDISATYANPHAGFTLSFDLYGSSTADPGLIFGFGGSGSPGASVWLYTPASYGFGHHFYSYDVANTWQHYSFDMTADVADAILNAGVNPAAFSINLQSGNSASLIYLDNVAFVAAIPEPATWSGLAGLVALAFAWRRGRARAKVERVDPNALPMGERIS